MIFCKKVEKMLGICRYAKDRQTERSIPDEDRDCFAGHLQKLRKKTGIKTFEPDDTGGHVRAFGEKWCIDL